MAVTSISVAAGRPQCRAHPLTWTIRPGHRRANVAASACTSARALAQPGRPAHAVTRSHGEEASTPNPRASASRSTPAAPSRPGSTTLRHGVTRACPARSESQAIWGAASLPSGAISTAAPAGSSLTDRPASAAPPSSPGRTRPAGRAPDLDFSEAASAGADGSPSRSATASRTRAWPSGRSAIRHALAPSAALSSRKASANASMAVTIPGTGLSPGKDPGTANPFSVKMPSPMTAVTSAPSPATSPRPSSIANRNRPGSRASRGRAHSAASRARTSPVSSGPPSRPASGEARMFRTRSWVRDGRSPAADSSPVSAAPASGASPRNCTLPREVSSARPSPWSLASRARTRS